MPQEAQLKMRHGRGNSKRKSDSSFLQALSGFLRLFYGQGQVIALMGQG